MTIEEELNYYQARLDEMPADLLKAAVGHVRKVGDNWPKEEWSVFHETYGLIRWFEHIYDEANRRLEVRLREEYPNWGESSVLLSNPHRDFGMGLRNSLREAGLLDDSLPLKNWDDYYIQVLEIALRFRKERES